MQSFASFRVHGLVLGNSCKMSKSSVFSNVVAGITIAFPVVSIVKIMCTLYPVPPCKYISKHPWFFLTDLLDTFKMLCLRRVMVTMPVPEFQLTKISRTRLRNYQVVMWLLMELLLAHPSEQQICYLCLLETV